MSIERLAVCDVCRNAGRKTRRYTVSRPAADGRKAKMRAVDLCSEHEKPILALLNLPARAVSRSDRTKVKKAPRKAAPPSLG